MQLIIDGHSSDDKLLQDEELLRRFLDHYPAEIGMTRICTPVVVRYVGPKHEDWGISGFVMIAESHISVHTFVVPRFVNIDVFSCKDFDYEKALDDIRRRFKLVKMRTRLIDRTAQPVPLETISLKQG
ncbi:MAG: S-adenosylmethionine decarboxylase [Chloroflexota bacterium]